ncbi:hypothetical protein B0H11DRAFT_2420765 [Mycena galericulata]|nr:hypothetical protein B0H11DRAFT_2420765 [Mycena galericulata]
MRGWRDAESGTSDRWQVGGRAIIDHRSFPTASCTGDPQPLVFNGITCPSCTAPLMDRGRIRSGPLTVRARSSSLAARTRAPTTTSTQAPTRRCCAARRSGTRIPRPADCGDAGVAADVGNWQARGVSSTKGIGGPTNLAPP